VSTVANVTTARVTIAMPAGIDVLAASATLTAIVT
jgi:hypothetical protein